MRIDQWLFKNHFAKSRTQAEDMIARGDVKIFSPQTQSWDVVRKPSQKVDEDLELKFISISSELNQFVSRAGLKLKKAIDRLGLNLSGLNVLDVGQSTGGFTDCVLQEGAAQVVGVEVGHGQLATKLKQQPKNITFENLDIRKASDCENFMKQSPFDMAVVDASFISLTQVLPITWEFLKPSSTVLALVKPQFELTAQDLNRRGVVKSEEKLQLVKVQISDYVKKLSGADVQDFFESAEKGKDGNQEFFIFIKKNI